MSDAQQSPGSANTWTKRLPKVPWGLVIGDPHTGEILAHNEAMGSLLCSPVPSNFDGFVDGGFIARPDFAQLRTVSQSTEDIASDSHVRIHRPDGSLVLAHVRVARFTDLDAKPLFICTVQLTEVAALPENTFSLTSDLVLICDQNLIIRWADPNLAALGIDPNEQAGTSALATVHPNEIARTTDIIRSLVAGPETTIEFVTRAIGPNSAWALVKLRVDRLVGDTPAFILRIRPALKPGRPLTGYSLSRRELAVVGGLFDGLRSSQIAVRDFVSDKTVRNQLSSAYAKLGVSGREELIELFERPERSK